MCRCVERRTGCATIASAPSEPAKLASGIVDSPKSATSALKVIASMAPSEAPAETPSVSGEASGLCSSAWKMTPDTASAAPTSAAASTRGTRATKKICASMLSAHGFERLKTSARRIGVLPIVGASSSASAVSRPKPARPEKAGCRSPRRRSTACTSVLRAKRHHGEVTRTVVERHVASMS